MSLNTVIIWIIFTIVGLIITDLAGIGVSGISRMRLKTYECTAVGFVTMIGLIELSGWFFVAFQLPRIGFEILVFLVILLLLILGLKYYRLLDRKKHAISMTAILVIGVTLFLILMTMVLYRSDADDSFYVSNVALFKVSDVLNPYDSSFGIETLGTVPMYDFQIWEAFMAVLCRVFRLEATTMMHSVCVPVLLIVSASAFLFLGRVLFDNDDKRAALFYIFMSVFHLFGGYAVYSEGSFLLSRLWQGKAVYLNIVLPVMIAVMLKNARERGKTFVLQLMVCMLAGIALNPTSMYVMGFQMLFMVLAISIVRRDAKYMLHIIPAVASVIFFTAMVYYRTHQFDGQIEAASKTDGDFVRRIFESFVGDGKLYILFFLISLIIVAKLGSRIVRIYLLWTPLLMLITIWNPWIGRLVAENITMTPSYWRVFWLLPIGQTIAAAGILLCTKMDKHRVGRIVIIIYTVISLTLPGKWMFSSENNFIKANNVQKVLNEVLTFGEIITEQGERPVVLACDAFSTTLRQQYADIELIYSRGQYILDLFLYRGEEEQAADRIYLMNIINGKTEDFAQVGGMLQKYRINYIIVENSNTLLGEYLLKNDWRKVADSSQYTLYQQD